MRWVWVVIPLVLFGFIVIQDANFAYGLSCPRITLEEKIKETPLIFSGHLISIEQSNESQNKLIANFQILEIFKGNNTDYVSLTTFEDDIWGIHFEEEPNYIVHAEFFDNVLSIDPLCGFTNEFHTEEAEIIRKILKLSPHLLQSPNQQMKTGILSTEVECKVDYSLIFKHDNSPACVKPETAEKLMERGWVINENKHLELENKSEIINGCKDVEGTWLDEYNECESSSIEKPFENYCDGFNGTYDQCNSSCRHYPAGSDRVCTSQCIAVCEFD